MRLVVLVFRVQPQPMLIAARNNLEVSNQWLRLSHGGGIFTDAIPAASAA
jgi:hypothetical protein